MRTPNQWLSHAQPVGPRHTPCSPQKDSGVRRTAAASRMHSGRPTVVNTDLCTVAVSRIEPAARLVVGFASVMSKATLPTKLGGGTNLSREGTALRPKSSTRGQGYSGAEARALHGHAVILLHPERPAAVGRLAGRYAANSAAHLGAAGAIHRGDWRGAFRPFEGGEIGRGIRVRRIHDIRHLHFDGRLHARRLCQLRRNEMRVECKRRVRQLKGECLQLGR